MTQAGRGLSIYYTFMLLITHGIISLTLPYILPDYFNFNDFLKSRHISSDWSPRLFKNLNFLFSVLTMRSLNKMSINQTSFVLSYLCVAAHSFHLPAISFL